MVERKGTKEPCSIAFLNPNKIGILYKTRILLLSFILLSFYGKAQVDNFTGTATANVPLFGYSVDGLDLGISLSYNTKGIKVDDVAGNVGLGWTLNASSYIQRDMKGIEDDISTYSGALVEKGYWVRFGPFTYTSADTGDYEPDIFTANLAGRTLRFSLIPTGDINQQPFYRVVTYPKSSIKVELIYAGVSQTNYLTDTVARHNVGISFKITDEKGNKFEFEPADYKIVENGPPMLKTIQKVDGEEDNHLDWS